LRDQWYGDARDLVKWAVLLHLAQSYSVKRILQVAYLRQSNWGRIEVNGDRYPIPQTVIDHFRNIHNILSLPCEPSIEVIDSLFDNRDRYKQAIEDAIARQHPSIIFLDPDTGLEPKGRPGFEHVLNSEIEYIWNKMAAGDIMALYQHQQFTRNGISGN
jgi:hypothetical protein